MHCGMHNFTRKCQGAGKNISLILITDYTLFLFHALNYITGVKNVFFCPEFSLGRGSLFWSFLSVVCDKYIYIIKCSHPCLFFFHSYIITVISRNFILTNYCKIPKISASMYKPPNPVMEKTLR